MKLVMRCQQTLIRQLQVVLVAKILASRSKQTECACQLI